MKNITTVKLVRKYANELSFISKLKNHKQKFRIDYVEQVIAKWKEFGSKPKISLFDLPENYKVRFDEKFIALLKSVVTKLQKEVGLDRVKRKYGVNFYFLEESLAKNTSVTIKTLKSFLPVLNQFSFQISEEDFENHMIAVGHQAQTDLLNIKQFPIDITDKAWAPIVGIILDTCLKKNFLFSSMDQNLANNVHKSLREIGINPYFKKVGNNYKIKGTNTVRDLLYISGINTKEKQISSNICLPPWVFKTSRKYQAIVLAKFLDTEGYVCKSKGAVRFAQANRIYVKPNELNFLLRKFSQEFIIGKTSTKRVNFQQLTGQLKENVLSSPPLILITTQLLLKHNRINSHLYPLRVNIDGQENISALWNLNIQTNKDIATFHELCGLFISISYKKQRLGDALKTNFPLPKGLSKHFFLSHALSIQKLKGSFTVSDLITSTRRNKKSVYNEVGVMENKGLIYSDFKKGHVKHRKLTEAGKAIINEKECSLDSYETIVRKSSHQSNA